MCIPSAALTRRATFGLAVGLAFGTISLAPTKLYPRPARAETRHFSAMQATDSIPPTAVIPPGAVNLRDIGEVDPQRLKKKTLYRCSQIYTKDVLRELKIKTVIDLRGRAERSKRHKQVSKEGSQLAPAPAGEGSAEPPRSKTPPPVLPSADIERLTGDGKPESALDSTASVDQADFTVTKRRNGSQSGTESDTEGDVQRASNTAELAVGLEVTDATTEAFNVIPAKEFGLIMLRMPRCVTVIEQHVLIVMHHLMSAQVMTPHVCLHYRLTVVRFLLLQSPWPP